MKKRTNTYPVSGEGQLAVFDFDGILFRPGSGWRVIHPHAGLVGSTARVQQISRFFEIVREKKPDADISEFFAIDEFEYDRLNPEYGNEKNSENRQASRAAAIDLLPPELLEKTIRKHSGERRTLAILSNKPYRGLDRIIFKMFPGNQWLGQESLFSDAIVLPAARGNFPGDAASKLGRISALLRYHETPESPDYFDRIILHTTDRELAILAKDFIENKKETFYEGRNALMLYYICHPGPEKVQTENDEAGNGENQPRG